MNVSARNVFAGTISAVLEDEVCAEIEVTTPGGDKIVAIVTDVSLDELDLVLGKELVAYVKAPSVILLAGEAPVKFSARNHWAGVVVAIEKGAVNSSVELRLAGGSHLYAVVTNEAVLELGLREGEAASALINASQVVLAVAA